MQIFFTYEATIYFLFILTYITSYLKDRVIFIQDTLHFDSNERKNNTAARFNNNNKSNAK